MKIESIKQLIDINNPKSLAIICILLGAAAKFGFPPDCLLAVFVLAMVLFMRICDVVKSKLLAVLAGFCFGFGYFSLGAIGPRGDIALFRKEFVLRDCCYAFG